MDFVQDTSIKESNNTAVEKKIRVMINFFENNGFHLSDASKKSSKEVVPITCTLEKKFYAPATIKGLWVVSFRAE